jgi:RNA polymerase sigma-70 factor (ECF subfamily)
VTSLAVAVTGGRPLQAPAAPLQADLDRDDVARAAAGDHAAFERLYHRHSARVASLAWWLLDAGEVEDAVQEVFIRVWQKLGTFAGQSAFATWLHRVAVNLMLRRRQTSGLARKRHHATDAPLLDVAGPREHPDLKVAIERAVDLLPAGAREVFVLHDMEGYKHEEIARMLGVDAGTSRSQLHRARLLLRQQLAT